MTNSSKLVYEFTRSSTERIRAALSTFKGKQYADLRIFFEGDDGGYYPSKKGINVSLDLLPELDKAVKQLKEAAGTPRDRSE